MNTRRSSATHRLASVFAVGVVALWGAACAGLGGAGSLDGPSSPASPETGVQTAPLGLAAIEALEFPPLRFDPPVPERFELSNGVPVLYLHDASLPLVELSINVKGGYAYFDRSQYGAASGLLSLMRNAGTETFTPDSLDAFLEFHALGLRTSTNGARQVLAVAGLRRQLDEIVGLWREILLRPRFDPAAVERWRVRELEAVRRRSDFPGTVAVLAFNRLMYGDYPTGWIMTPEDLAAERVTPARLRALHRRVICPERAVIGVAGAVGREDIRAALEAALEGWTPCDEGPLDPPSPPTLTADPRVYVVPGTRDQSTVVVGQPGGVRLDSSPDYFASRVANWVIGGSGFTSRLMARVRTEEGLAYSAASIWGSARSHERVFGAVTQTRAERTVEAARLVLATLVEARDSPPDSAEIALAREAMANGYVFGFTSPAQIVARQVGYEADGLPDDWLTRYFDGIRAVTPADVAAVLRKHVQPEAFTVLVVGDTTRFDASALGPVTVLDPQEF